MKFAKILKSQYLQTCLWLFVLLLGLGLTEKALCKTGTVTITAPANNNTFTNDFLINVRAPMSWDNGVLSNGQYNSYFWNGDGCYYISVYPKIDFFWNGSYDIIGKMIYSIDGKPAVTLQDMYAAGGEYFSVR